MSKESPRNWATTLDSARRKRGEYNPEMRNFLMHMKDLAKVLVDVSLYPIRHFYRILVFTQTYGVSQTFRLSQWADNDFKSPAPNVIKWKVMKRWGGRETWIETGTYLGETTSQLAKDSEFVISLEPEPTLYKNAQQKFRNSKNIVLLNGTSELKLREAVFLARQRNLVDMSFWLDGHFSEGLTFLGELECPVIFELQVIAEVLSTEEPLTILIDDVRCFSRTNEVVRGYPSLSYLVNFADKHNLFWVIEHDIFIMSNRVKQ